MIGSYRYLFIRRTVSYLIVERDGATKLLYSILPVYHDSFSCFWSPTCGLRLMLRA